MRSTVERLFAGSIPSAAVRRLCVAAGRRLARVRIRGLPRLYHLTAPLVVGPGVQMLECAAGFRITVEARDYFGCMMLYGRYAPDIVSLFREIVSPGDSVIDVGAQIGYLTCHLASLVGQSGRVHSFEPDPNALGRLRAAVKENGFSWVDVFPVAASDTEGEIRFHVSETVGWSTAVSGTHLVNLAETRVASRRIDGLAASGQIRRPVKLVKIDVEGFECAVLDGMQALIAEDRPLLTVEVNPPMLKAAGRTPADLMDRISRHGYRIYGISEAKGMLNGGRVRLQPVDPARDPAFCDVLCVPREMALPGTLHRA
jgi:FkbM family methyltransferase